MNTARDLLETARVQVRGLRNQMRHTERALAQLEEELDALSDRTAKEAQRDEYRRDRSTRTAAVAA